MMRMSLPMLALSALFCACGADQHAPGTSPATATGSAPMGDHGEPHVLGSVTLAGHTVEVVQEGEVVAGKEAAFDLRFGKSDQPLPTARVWIGVQSGTGSMKARLTKESAFVLHGHVEVPDPIPEGAMVWVEIEDAGTKLQNSFAWHR